MLKMGDSKQTAQETRLHPNSGSWGIQRLGEQHVVSSHIFQAPLLRTGQNCSTLFY